MRLMKSKLYALLLVLALVAGTGSFGAVAAAADETPAADTALFNFEEGNTHGFTVSNGSVEVDPTQAFAGQSSLKVNFTGEDMAELGLDRPGGDIPAGTQIEYRIFIPEGTNLNLQPYIFGAGWAWNGQWNQGGGEKGKWITLNVGFTNGAAPPEKLGIQIFPEGPGHIWVDSITYPGFGVPPDEEPPTAPANITASVTTSTEITLNWDASSDNVGVVDYEVYVNGSRAGVVTGTTFTASGLQPRHVYEVRVKAYDDLGNSAWSEPVTASTASAGATVTAAFNENTRKVSITGTVSSGQGHQVTVLVKDPQQNMHYLDQQTLKAAGNYAFEFGAVQALPGAYQVTISADGIDAVATASFVVPGSTGGTPPVQPTDPKPNSSLTVNADSFNNPKDGKISFSLPAGKNELILPRNAFELADGNAILISAGEATLTIPPSVLKSLGQLTQDQGASLSIRMKALTESEAAGLAGSSSAFRIAGSYYSFEASAIKGSGEAVKLTNFEEPVEVAFAYESDNVDENLLGVYYYNPAAKKWEYCGGTVDASNHRIAASLSHFSTYAVMEYKKAYADVSSERWSHDAITVLSAKHLVNGKTDDRFAPTETTTRAEFSAMLARLLGLSGESGTPFADVKKEAWYADSVASLYKAKLITGKSSDRFAPNEVVTREEMAVLLVRAFAYATGKELAASGSLTFSDKDQISAWASKEVTAAVDAELMAGTGNGLFAPQAVTSREQTAQAIYNFLKLLALTVK
ncbi:S-layer homology domain-containing protein [Paenibacillus silvisoli]|uniref:S-layer homology domain-containing protein n=1 Tax=Paenibacillus silvisoli TaxID=3110539 RepID=UPI0028059137|nr:S-layer homology domain-containing protein [Paenibacillus silvisoli]